MASETAFRMTLTLARQPYCPVCATPLIPQAVRFRSSIAICVNCLGIPLEHWMQHLHTTNCPLLAGCWFTTLGLIWWMPPFGARIDSVRAMLELYEPNGEAIRRLLGTDRPAPRQN